MADENVPAPAPTRPDDQILPFAAWVRIGKSNHVLDLQKRQKNLIFQIAVDILQNTNFFRAFTASASLDEDWFTLDANLLREALEITPIDQAHPFVSPPSGDAIMDFVNEPSYPELIICHLGRIHNIHQRSASPLYLVEEDLRLGNLKFVSKDEIDEVSGMPILNELISNNIRDASYYNTYLEMVAKNDQKVAAEKEGKKKSASTKHPSRSLPKKKPAHSEPEPMPEHESTSEEYDMEHAIQMSLESFQAQAHAHVRGKGKAIVTDEQAAQSLLALHTPKRRSTTDQFILQRQTLTTNEASTKPSAQPLDDTSVNIIRDSPSSADAETGARSDKISNRGDTEIVQITEELREDVEIQENVKEKTMELDQDQAGSDPGETLESRPQPE
ncbi:hypothetical protein Tco_0639075 [Tanacetum coccineum]